ncbi:MAG: Tol-Pal system protein TolB, partial [Luteimonas sp.]
MTRTLRRLTSTFVLLLFALLPLAAFAQQQGLEIDIVGGNAAALPIAVVPMPYQGSGATPSTDVAQVIRADLDRSGQFRTLADRDIVERPTSGSEVNYPTWRLLKQDFLLVGRVKDAGDG